MKMDSISYSRFLPLVCSAFLLLFSLLLLSVQRLPWTMINIKRELSIAENMKVKLLAVQNENQAILDSLAPLLQMRKTCIKAQDEQDASLQFRERIESAAKEFGIQIRNMGNVHKTILSDNMLLLEVSFSADGKTEDTVSLLRSMSHGEPRLFWESIAIKPV